MKAVLRIKFITVNVYIKKRKISNKYPRLSTLRNQKIKSKLNPE